MSKTIPVRTFKDILESLNIPWHSQDYILGTETFSVDEASEMNCRQDFYEISVIIRGSLEIMVNNRLLALKPGSILVNAPYTVIQAFEIKEEFVLRTICFAESYIAKSLFNIKVLDFLDFFVNSTGNVFQLNDGEFQVLDNIYVMLDEAVNEEREGKDRKHYISTMILAYLFKVMDIFENNFKDKGILSVDAEMVSKFQLLILKKPNNHLEFYARELHISKQHLIRTVKKITNKTPHTLISESIIINAKILLKSPDLTLTEISDELSFSDTSSFGKFFKKHTGISPNSYRNEP